MTRHAWALPALLCMTLTLGACGSTRLAGAPVARANASTPVYNEPVDAVPSAPVTSEPLPPPPGTPGPVASLDPALSAPSPLPTPPREPQPAAPAGSSRSTMVGGWTARDAAGSCRVQLSSSPALDLYRASAAGCANRDLARVTAWDFRDGEVYLYQPGGSVAARLRPAGGSLDGVLAKSGAPLSLAR